MTPQDFYAAGFQLCPQPPLCWRQEMGTFYTRMQAQGTAYVRHLTGTSGEVEAFVGDWARPWTYWYCWGYEPTLKQLLRRLS
ncbi:hypothetical protein [uncultured Hymenobacter sp.]|uniref:hypothetical protein n=1 Tax=uncultured Hymenobacter sp. TaxID=170016 RepID=UPI0035CA713F